jgi:hypothetical protein
MAGSCGKKSDTYLYEGDEVKEGVMVAANAVDISHTQIDAHSKVMITESVVINGHLYCNGTIILIDSHMNMFSVKSTYAS